METSNQLANRFREVFLNGTWIANTNYKDQLSGLNWKQAITKIGSLNSILALTYHINYYVAGVLQVFEGGNLDIRDKYSFDFPDIKSEEEWNENTCTEDWEYPEIFGCTNPNALNYDALAICDNGSCIACVNGCTDILAINYNSSATCDDGSCSFIPQGINYQAVARDATGDVLINQSLTIQLSIISDITTGNVSWQETHLVTTNDYGLFTAVIGQGTSTSGGYSATFDVVDWGSSNHLLKVEKQKSI